MALMVGLHWPRAGVRQGICVKEKVQESTSEPCHALQGLIERVGPESVSEGPCSSGGPV